MLTSPASASQDFGARQLATPRQFILRASIGHTIAHENHRFGRHCQQPGRLFEQVWVGRQCVEGMNVGMTSSTTGASMMSWGMQTYTGLMGGVAAILTARRSTRSSEEGSTTIVRYR